MKNSKVKSVKPEVLAQCRRNGDRVDQIIREAAAVEGEVQRIVRQYTQRLRRKKARLAERVNAATAGSKDKDGDENESE